MRYNIPGVFTSVIDRSYVQPLLVEGRSVLIAGFSKFGEDKFYEFGDADSMEFTLGAMNVEKYGMGLMYGLGALTKTRNVIFKRLMPTDADYANLIFMSDGTVRTKDVLIDSDILKREIDLDSAITEAGLVVDELEFKARAGQQDIVWKYNPDNISIFLAGGELTSGKDGQTPIEFTAQDGVTIRFATPLTEDKIVNLYTTFDTRKPAEVPVDETISFIKQEQRINIDTTTVIVDGGYKDKTGTIVAIWCTVNGLDIENRDYTAMDGSNIVFHFGGIQGNGLIQDDVLVIHGLIDNSDQGNVDTIKQDILAQDNVNTLNYPQGYNPDITAVSVNGLMLGKDDYTAEDGSTIYFGNPLNTSDVVRLHTLTPGESLNMWGALLAKAQGEGYNDLFVSYRPAYDVERHYTDAEGDTKYKFNFLKAVVYEQTPVGKRTVSEEFTVSLLDKDPVSGMPIVGNITGENLFIDEKFGESNIYLDYYSNMDLMPQLYEEMNIDELTRGVNSGVEGENRVILKNQITNVSFENQNKNIELFVGNTGEIEFRAVSIEGREKIHTLYINPLTGISKVYAISMIDGLISIYQSGTTGNVTDTLYIDGYDSFYELLIIDENAGLGTEKLTLGKLKYTNTRQKLFNILITEDLDSTWQMASGSNGENLIKDGKLNMYESTYRYGEPIADGYYKQNAKQLLLYFFEQNETIHEVLYPELDFDYVPDWTSDLDVQVAIIDMADEIGFTMPIVSLPRATSPEKDYKQRVEELYVSSFNTAIYSGQNNDDHYLSINGRTISLPNSYYAMVNHLDVDNEISITEPMANVVKGQLPVKGAKLSYIAKSKDIEKLRMVQINTIIKETDGIYFIDQLTSYKAASKLSRINVVKPIHRMRKDLPRILKDLLQHKATTNIINDAQYRTERYMERWKVKENNITDGIFSEIVVTPVFIQEELKLIISIAVTPIGTIEKIEIPITVY